jgi:hypothetical protein
MIELLREQVGQDLVRISIHASIEMADEDFTLSDVYSAINNGNIIENYPDHPRGSCCLVGGTTQEGRPLHVVCTTSLEKLLVITVYEPKLPKWITPRERKIG